MTIDAGTATIIASVIAAIAAITSTIYSKMSNDAVANINNNNNNNVKVNTTNPINVQSPDIKMPPITITSTNNDVPDIVSLSMNNIVINIYLIIYNIHVEQAELELIKNCSTLQLYLNDNYKDIKEYCKQFCKQVSSEPTINLQELLLNDIENFEILCRQYLLQNTHTN